MHVDVAFSLSVTQTALRLAVLGASGDLDAALKNFERETGICGKTDGKLVILDYDTINVKWTQAFGYVCRGLILDAGNDFAVVAFGLPKFFNYGETYAAQIDWSTAVAVEKLDGSMVQRYWNPYTERFEYSTRFQLHADLAKNKVSGSSEKTWLQLIETCVNPLLTEEQPKHETWVFEVMSPLNRIVVIHRGFRGCMIAVRDNITLQEKKPFLEPPFGVPFSSAVSVIGVVSGFNGLDSEGFVVVDANFNRVKIKAPAYVNLHRLKDNINSVGAIVNLARGNDYEEVTANFPELKAPIEQAVAAINDIRETHEAAWQELKHIEDRKEFALAVMAKKLSVSAFLFQLRDLKFSSVKEAMAALPENKFQEMVKRVLDPSFAEVCVFAAPGNALAKIG
jgi:hypothetical protein